MTIIHLCLALFLLLQVADAYATTYGIRNGLKEANPIMRFMIETQRADGVINQGV